MIDTFLENPPLIRNLHKIIKNKGTEPYTGKLPAAMILFDAKMDIELEDSTHSIKKNTVGFFDQGTKRTFTFKEQCSHRTVHLDLPCDRNTLTTPLLLNAGKEFKHFITKYDHAFQMKNIHPQQSRSIIWELIWSIKEFQISMDHKGSHPILVQAVTMIEDRLSQKINIAELSKELNFSQSQLNKIFRNHFSLSIEGYIKKRRMEDAEFYLTQSHLSIKEIAYRVGYPDLQHFNKVVRQSFQKCPRDMR